MVEDLKTQGKIGVCETKLDQPPGKQAVLHLLSDQRPALLQLCL